MDGEINLLTLLSLIVAVVAIIKLRSVLGRRTPDDEARIDQQRREAAEMQKRAANPDPSDDNIIHLPRRDANLEGGPEAQPPIPVEELEERIKAVAKGNSTLESDLKTILGRDPEFDPDQFMNGARQAYEMIVTAFAEGNKKLLREMLSEDVMKGFGEAIDVREQRGEIIDQSFVGINKSDITTANVSDSGIASITIRYVSQLITATRNKEGKVIDGDDQRVIELVDVWTFSRDISSPEARQDLNWKLVSTT